MKNFRKLIALVLCAALLLSLAGCTRNPAETTAPPTTSAPTEPVPAADVYAAAREILDSAQHVSSELLITTHMSVAGDEFSEQSTQTLTYKDIGTENAVIVMQEDVLFGVHSTEADGEASKESLAYREIWYQDKVYAELRSTYRYCGPLDAEAALARYTPVVLLDAQLYALIEAQPADDGTLIQFSSPTAAESWAVPEEAELVEASGTATVSADGRLTEMTYTVTYTYGPSEITLEVRSRPLETPKTVTAPANPDTYISISCIDALRMNIAAPAMMFQADSITTSGVESMFCQAAGFMRNQSSTINQDGRGEDSKAKIETGVYIMDYSTQKSDKYDLEETFIDGTLTTVEDKGEPTTRDDITWEDIQVYIAPKMLTGILDYEYWKDVNATDMGSVYLLEYTLSDSFGTSMENSICDMLWDDPYFLRNLASKYENKELNGYLSVDKYTGLPVAAGYYYEGVHTIDGTDYKLTLQYDQSIEAPAKGAYQEITDRMPEEAEPENKPTPLFYHVTGENGQEMWLLGTIHVGDERTAYLPKEIYDAFAASDALALECDTEAFDALLEEDEKLSEEVSNYYFYAGGLVSLEGLMEDDDYAQAVKLMKATGNYNMNMPFAKPYVWSSSIDEFYLRQGYQLHRDQGVEERLHDWAEEQDKEILEVESNLFQIKLLTGFSNDLQLLMLEGSMETSARASWEGTMDLYEKWCAGDEAVLREELSDAVDTSEFTEEELAEYEETKHLIEEYNKAISYDRNDGMLKKAIEYLESGKVVFYAVGLAHLLNDVNGLVDTLREAGYTVELVTYAG